MVLGCELNGSSVSCPQEKGSTCGGCGPKEGRVEVIRMQGQRRWRRKLVGTRQGGAMGNRRANERGRAKSKDIVDGLVVFEEIRASVVGGYTARCRTSLARAGIMMR